MRRSAEQVALSRPGIVVSMPDSQMLPVVPAGDAQTDVAVGISVRVRRTFALDNVGQTFGVNLHVIMRWQTDEKFDRTEDGLVGPGYGWEPEWKPRWIVKNVMEEIANYAFFALEANPLRGQTGQKQNICFCESKSVVRCYNAMDLRSFPFDVQKFEISIEMEGVDVQKARFVPYADDVLLADCLADRCGFEDMKLLADKSRQLTFQLYETDRHASRRKMALSGLKVVMVFTRKASYYVTNVALIMFAITSFALTGWAIDVADVNDRLGLDFTLLLTAVAFKLVVVSMLPPVSYQTKLDWYVMMCLLFLSFVTVMHALVPSMCPDPVHETPVGGVHCDIWIFIGTSILWVVLNLVCVLLAISYGKLRR